MADLEFRNVSKRYRIQHESTATGLVDKLRNRFFPNTEEFWALRDVNFAIEKGEAVGIVGHNGAGKSTILKILSRITAPSDGVVLIRGRLAALLEVGSGFHPELTGRENIFLSASILGMRRAETMTKLDKIIEFAEIEQFIDVPVKRYSSGMYVRLGFAIAAHLDPDILLLDEVLAVGDVAFQRKCLQRVDEMRRSGMTIVFISHDLKAVQDLCTRCILMQRGQMQMDGDPAEVIKGYQSKGQLGRARKVDEERERYGLPKCLLNGITFYSASGESTLKFGTGGPMRVLIRFEAAEPVKRAIFMVRFCAMDSTVQCQFFAPLSQEALNLPVGHGLFEFTTDSLPLQPGFYYIDAGICMDGASHALDWHHNCFTIQMEAARPLEGVCYLPQSSKLVTAGLTEQDVQDIAAGAISR
jgi:lipopolysaccharide transport system ATP-binding protein